ncbi:MAG: hypothetical protein H6823_11690 [Planctomycetaceae bacterium]|nr:hypothetical protein [Planctomycetales bacterium]MCB9938898.1 hypothetical protein [Planctomycetaceae bacterium]
MSQIRLLFLLFAALFAGCGPNVSGPSNETPIAPEEEVFDPAEEAAAEAPQE